MSDTKRAVIVLAAGLGTRMKSARPKVLHELGGRAMIAHLMDTVATLGADRTVVVTGPGMDPVAAAVAPAETAIQAERLGTGDAVKAARAALDGFAGTVLIAYADTPLVRAETLAAMIAAREAGAAVVVLAFHAAPPNPYGRLRIGDDGNVAAIVEAKDATPDERAGSLCNSGIMAVDGTRLFDLIDRLGTDNAKGEYYLTDIVGLAVQDGLVCTLVEGDETELMGINSKADLAVAEAIVQTERRAVALADGVTLIDPAAVWLAHDTELAPDVTIHPNVVFGPGVRVGEGAEIKPFSHLEGAVVGPGCIVGPFARLRPGSQLSANARVGNFVELKDAVLGEGAKANHLAYLGDAEIGAGSNIGAGTITCNYDGAAKHRTVIGTNVFIGSNSVLVAPVTIGDDAFVAAASAVTQDVEPGGLAIGRARQINKPEQGRTLKQKLRDRKES